MSEVQRFWSHEARNIRCVREADFDRVTAERDAALGRDTGFWGRTAARRQKEIDALQQRLTAADERADVLEQALKFYADRDHYSVDDGLNWDSCSGEPYNILWHEDQPWFIEDGSIAKAALKPAEGGGDDTTLEEDREDFKKVFVRINTKQGQSISLSDMIARYEKKP